MGSQLFELRLKSVVNLKGIVSYPERTKCVAYTYIYIMACKGL